MAKKKKNGSQYMPTEKYAFNPKPYKSSTPNTISEEVSNVGQENINAGKARSFVWEHFTKQYMDEVSKQNAIIIPWYFLGIQNLEQVIYVAIIWLVIWENSMMCNKKLLQKNIPIKRD